MSAPQPELDWLAVALLALVTLQRVAELIWSRRNERILRSLGAVEHGARHYPAIVLVHAAWLAGLWILGSGVRPQPGWTAAFLGLQVLRAWVLVSLGWRWTTRVLVIPGAPLVRTGPYRLMAHPNYAVVAAEFLVLPLAFGLIELGLVFSALNAAVLAVRIRVENRALAASAAAGGGGPQ